MTRTPDPLSLATVEANIAELSEELSKLTADQYQAARNSAVCRHAYRVAYARAYLAADGTIAEREAMATVAVEERLEARELAEAVERARVEQGRNLRAQLEGMRSLLVGLRDAVVHSSGQGG